MKTLIAIIVALNAGLWVFIFWLDSLYDKDDKIFIKLFEKMERFKNNLWKR